MPDATVGSETRDVVTFVLPGAVGVGLGVLVGSVVSESLVPVAAFAVFGAVAGHTLGYLLVRRRRGRVD